MRIHEQQAPWAVARKREWVSWLEAAVVATAGGGGGGGATAPLVLPPTPIFTLIVVEEEEVVVGATTAPPPPPPPPPHISISVGRTQSPSSLERGVASGEVPRATLSTEAKEERRA